MKYKYLTEKNQFEFVLSHNFDTVKPKFYIALGISMDDVMGDDVVFSCANVESKNVEYSYNVGRKNWPGVTFQDPQPVSELSTRIDGVCHNCIVDSHSTHSRLFCI